MKNIIIQLILFCCMISTVLAQNKIKQYEYWLDTDFSGKQVVNITPTVNFELTTISANTLMKPGLHTLNIRFQDSNGKYSSVITQLVEAFTVNPQILSLEYWFDQAYNTKTVILLTASSVITVKNIDISTVSNGRHTFNIRFLDRAAKWSAVQTALIYKSAGSSVLVNSVAGYRYWFDDDFTGSVYKNISSPPTTLNSTETLDLSGFPKGNNHILNIQFKDVLGMWSAVQSGKLYNSGPGSILNNVITAYRYWIDNDFANNIYKVINPSLVFVSLDETIDLSSFKGNNRLLKVQIKDALGLWSSVVTDTVNVTVNSDLDDEFASGDFRTYPNPCKGMLTIAANRTISDASVSITNAIGKMLYQEHFDIFVKKILNLSNLLPGIYYLQIVEPNNANKVTIRKIILQN